MRLKSIQEPSEIVHPEIQERAVNSSKSYQTIHFLVFEKEQEVAFLSVDTRPNVPYLVLYELFVPHQLRNRGIGSRVLLEAEVLAKNLGYEKITVFPSPRELDFPKERLWRWFRKHGYILSSQCESELEKSIAPSDLSTFKGDLS
jgi:GNAT superfamily N-acetyltransferase